MELDFTTECVIKLLAATLCGALLGLERKHHNQVIGMRTLILITVSSALLSILSSYMATASIFAPPERGDPTRIAAGVISGIGFLGGGAIMKQGLNIKGLTSAAIIWTSATFGLAIGAGLYVQVGVALLISLSILIGLEKINTKFFPATRSKSLHLCFENETLDMNKISQTIKKHGMIIADVNTSRAISVKRIILHYSVQAPREDDFDALIADLNKIGTLSEFSITD